MLDASLVLCALAGIAAAVGIRRYQRPDTREIRLEVERGILAKCMEHLEQPEYAAERNILYEKYQRRLEHVSDTLSGKKTASDMTAKEGEREEQKAKNEAVAGKPGGKKAEAPKKGTGADKGQKTTVKDPVHSKDAKTDNGVAPATKVAPPESPKVGRKGKGQTKKIRNKPAGKDTGADVAPATKVAPPESPKGGRKGKGQTKKMRNKPAGKDTGATRDPAPKAPVHDTPPKQTPGDISQTGKRPAAESVDVKDVKPEKVEKGEQTPKGQGADDVEAQEDLEKIKNDIRRALSKLEQVEAD